MTSKKLWILSIAATLIAGFSSADLRADDPKPDADGWLPLFNGKDLTGWELFSTPNKGDIAEVIKNEVDGKVVGYEAKLKKDGKLVPLWQVKDGLLVGSGPHSHLFTVKDDYTDFSYRVEAKINDKGNSGQYFRATFATGFPPGYEVQINATGGDPIKTGSLYPDGRTKLKEFKDKICVMNKAAHAPDEFFVQEVTVIGHKITIKVNGKQTIEFEDPNKTHSIGRFAVQGHDPGTLVTFKKIEWKPIAK